ncbi:MAG: hypothetical protein AAGF92_21135 [Myxococcota bacterium]
MGVVDKAIETARAVVDRKGSDLRALEAELCALEAEADPGLRERLAYQLLRRLGFDPAHVSSILTRDAKES